MKSTPVIHRINSNNMKCHENAVPKKHATLLACYSFTYMFTTLGAFDTHRNKYKCDNYILFLTVHQTNTSDEKWRPLLSICQKILKVRLPDVTR